MKKIVVFCAHNDDQLIGAGGALTKYAQEGIDVTTVIFSYGERSHPWLKTHVSRDMRKKEAEKANEIMGLGKIIFLGLEEGKFIENGDIIKKVTEIIKKKKPVKIFTHSIDDPHPDHQAVYKIVSGVIKKHKIKTDTYSFDIWNPLNIRKRNTPKLVVDITDTYSTKIKACQVHKSQKLAMLSLSWNIRFKAFANGLKNDVKYAEVFYKIN